MFDAEKGEIGVRVKIMRERDIPYNPPPVNPPLSCSRWKGIEPTVQGVKPEMVTHNKRSSRWLLAGTLLNVQPFTR